MFRGHVPLRETLHLPHSLAQQVRSHQHHRLERCRNALVHWKRMAFLAVVVVVGDTPVVVDLRRILVVEFVSLVVECSA